MTVARAIVGGVVGRAVAGAVESSPGASVPITVVGTASGSKADGSNVTIDLTAIVGLARDDIVYVFGGFARNGTPAVGSGDYATVFSRVTNPSLILARKQMGAVPDTSVVCAGDATAGDEIGYVAIALRGVNLGTPEDVAVVNSSGGGAGVQTDGPAITPLSGGRLVMTTFGRGGQGGTIAGPAGYTNLVTVQPAGGTTTFHAGLCTKQVDAAGPEDPGSWSGQSTGFGQIAVTAAIRPA